MVLAAADLPFTLIGDVATWPYAAAYFAINQPVPVPPVIHATAAPTSLPYLTQANNEPVMQTPEKDTDKPKPGSEKSPQLPLPAPRKVNPE